MRQIVLIAHNIRSAHNVGALLRTAEGLGLSKVYLTGYTPYPAQKNDNRLPHLSKSITDRIAKTALGAEASMNNEYLEEIESLLQNLKADGFEICALEQAEKSIPLNTFKPTNKVALIVGREVEGIELEVLDKVDKVVEIPMFGQKESFNVAQAAAMAMYRLKFA